MSNEARPRGIAGSGVIPELDGLRGVAIGLVLLHHFWPTTGSLSGLGWMAAMGWVGVDLFFVISGALITGILLDSRGQPAYFKNFFARRALRIFPLYYLFLAVVFALPLLRGGLDSGFIEKSGSPLWYVFYLGNVPEAFLGKDPPTFVALLWSLAIEEQFYLSFPFIVSALDRKKLTRLLVALVVFAPILRLVTALGWPAHERVQYQFALCRADVIALGALVAVALRDPRFRPKRAHLDLALAASVVVLCVTFALGGLDRTRLFGRVLGYSVVAVTFAIGVLWTLVNRSEPRTAPLRFRPLRYLGQICYGLYLLHRPASFLIERALGHVGVEPPPEAALVIDLAAAITLATLSWYAFEKPVLRLKKRFEARGGARAEASLPSVVRDVEPAVAPGEATGA